jgi:hypothetical protein
VSAECTTRARRPPLRRYAAVVLAVASISVTFLVPANHVYADPTSTCPDGHILLLAEIGSGKDKNNNGLVCGKIGDDGKVHGGPDDRTDDIIVT